MCDGLGLLCSNSWILLFTSPEGESLSINSCSEVEAHLECAAEQQYKTHQRVHLWMSLHKLKQNDDFGVGKSKSSLKSHWDLKQAVHVMVPISSCTGLPSLTHSFSLSLWLVLSLCLCIACVLQGVHYLPLRDEGFLLRASCLSCQTLTCWRLDDLLTCFSYDCQTDYLKLKKTLSCRQTVLTPVLFMLSFSLFPVLSSDSVQNSLVFWDPSSHFDSVCVCPQTYLQLLRPLSETIASQMGFLCAKATCK